MGQRQAEQLPDEWIELRARIGRKTFSLELYVSESNFNGHAAIPVDTPGEGRFAE